MKVTRRWLEKYVDLSGFTSDQIATTLTDLGLEVESIEEVSPIKGDVLVGEILEATQHPDADTLRVCKVNVNQNEPLNIVCGAPNARTGIKVCVATVGSVLPGEFKIKKSKIRGVPSFGMMCAEDELGISSNHDEIIELESSVNIGDDVCDIYGLKDTVFELGITPNRADCFGHIGVARELAAKLNRKLNSPSPCQDHGNNKAVISVSANSPRFVAMEISGLSTCPSPSWLQKLVEASGMRPINLIVDVTNFIMLENSQPIHAYDVTSLRGHKIIAQDAKGGEKLTTLDGKEHLCVAGDQLIWDEKGPIGLAGIMGGQSTEVKDTTTSILLEVASFDATRVRKTAKRLGIHSEASHRFERGTDITNCMDVAWRTFEVLCECHKELGLESPTVTTKPVDIYNNPWKENKIAVRTSRLHTLLNDNTIPGGEISATLCSIGLTQLDCTDDGERFLFSTPAHRMDLNREVDLIEEVARLRGFDKIPTSLPQIMPTGIKENPFIEFIENFKTLASLSGLNETVSFPFVSQKELDLFGFNPEECIKLKNALSADESYMRPTLLMGLYKALQGNMSRGVTRSNIFEISRGYGPSFFNQFLSAHIPEKSKSPFYEANLFSAVFDFSTVQKSWQKTESSDFYTVKQKLLSLLGEAGYGNFEFKNDSLPKFLHPAYSSQIEAGGKIIGFCGRFHPQITIDSIYVFEISLDALFGLDLKKKVQSEIPKFPAVHRDLSFLVDEGVTYSQIATCLGGYRKRHLIETSLFDVYKGKNISEGKKSMALSFKFQSAKKTLADKDVDQEIDLIKDALKNGVGAELRS